MSKDPKRLQSILRVRRIEEERRAGDLGRANAALSLAIQRVQAEQARHSERAMPSGPTSGTAAAFTHLLGSLSAEGCLRARGEATRATHHRTEVQAAWTEAARRVAALERLEGRWSELRAAEELRAEQLLLDELAGRRARSA